MLMVLQDLYRKGPENGFISILGRPITKYIPCMQKRRGPFHLDGATKGFSITSTRASHFVLRIHVLGSQERKFHCVSWYLHAARVFFCWKVLSYRGTGWLMYRNVFSAQEFHFQFRCVKKVNKLPICKFLSIYKACFSLKLLFIWFGFEKSNRTYRRNSLLLKN